MIHQRAALPSLLLLATRAFVVAAATAPAGATLQDEAHRPPHVVLVMADDMGYSDIGCYGSEIETPTLDRLAAGGLRFTQFYNTSRCCPTRAALLTGLYSHQVGIGLMTGDRGVPSYRGQLSEACVTLAEVLGGAGYGTYMSGKWHVTRHTAPGTPMDAWPLQRGFERFYGTLIGAGSFFDPTTLCRGNTHITPENDPEYQPESFYYTDAISDEGARFVREHLESSEEPLFLYLSYTSAHWPMHAPEEDIARHRGRYDGGYAPIRAARLERARELGVLEESWELSAQADDWERNPHKEWDIRNMETYAAMVQVMDRGIGRVVTELERAGALENTLFLYLQDNGGCAEGFGRRDNSEQAAKFDFEPFGPDDLQPQIWPPMQTRDGRWVRTGPEAFAGPEDTYVAYGRGWANVSNTPFRGYKHDAYEGGISSPLVVHWPLGIPEEQRGGVIHEVGHLIDLMPTLVEAARASYPEQRGQLDVPPMEGTSLLPALRGEALDREAPLCFEHHGNLALRDGRWKILSQYRKDQPRRWELYDMWEDRTELNDLAVEQPERLAEMVAAWEAWAERVGVQDWPF